jgi:peptidoglycan/LPS O-acetylase OafA/YrhL
VNLIVYILGLSYLLCVLSGRSRTAEPADIGGGWFLSGRQANAGMMPVRSRVVPQCATKAKRLPHRQSRPGRVWNIPFRGEMQKTPLSIGLLVVLPLGMALTEGWSGPPGVGLGPLPRRILSIVLQAAFPWLMTFGLMGLFRRLCPVESPAMRYLSDSAYWLYLAHLPLIIAAQYVVRDWPVPALAKFLLIVVVVSSFLLWTYQALVRDTWLGRFLNGPRSRPAPAGAPAVVA